MDELVRILTDLSVLANRVDGTERVGGAGDVAVPPELLHPVQHVQTLTTVNNLILRPSRPRGSCVYMAGDRQ